MTLHRALLLLLCSAGSAAAQQGLLQADAWSGAFDLRNRWVTDVIGSSQTYRSIVNLDSTVAPWPRDAQWQKTVRDLGFLVACGVLMDG